MNIKLDGDQLDALSNFLRGLENLEKQFGYRIAKGASIEDGAQGFVGILVGDYEIEF